MRFRGAFRRGLISLGCLAIAGLGALALGATWLHVPADTLPTGADAIVVLGGDHQARMLEAISLYHAGIAAQVWITGDQPPPGRSVSLAEAWRLTGRRNGVPEAVVTLLVSSTTWEDGRAIADRAAASGARHLVVVTSWYHIRRARCVIERQLGSQAVELAFVPAAGLPQAYEHWWRELAGWYSVTRELAALGYYWQRYGLAPWSCGGV